MPIEKPTEKKPGKSEISEAELKKVSGGTTPKSDTKSGIGSQSTGAGAGKVTFNPF